METSGPMESSHDPNFAVIALKCQVLTRDPMDSAHNLTFFSDILIAQVSDAQKWPDGWSTYPCLCSDSLGARYWRVA